MKAKVYPGSVVEHDTDPDMSVECISWNDALEVSGDCNAVPTFFMASNDYTGGWRVIQFSTEEMAEKWVNTELNAIMERGTHHTIYRIWADELEPVKLSQQETRS